MLEHRLNAPEATTSEHDRFLTLRLREWLIHGWLGEREFRGCGSGAYGAHRGPCDEAYDERDRKNSAEIRALHSSLRTDLQLRYTPNLFGWMPRVRASV